MTSKMMDNVKTVNSAVRTLLMVVVAGGLGYGVWLGYHNYIAPGVAGKQAIAELATLKTEHQKLLEQLKTLSADNDRMATSIKLLKFDRRAAYVEVLEKGIDDQKQPYLEVRFTEVDANGDPLGVSKDFTLQGNKIYVDAWVAKFKDRYIEQADALRGAALFKFKRIFGDDEKPSQAQSLESATNVVPDFYQQSVVSDFEKQIWADFHDVCKTPERQDELGLRNLGGQAPYVMAEEGVTYKVTVRSTGDISIAPVKPGIEDDRDVDE